MPKLFVRQIHILVDRIVYPVYIISIEASHPMETTVADTRRRNQDWQLPTDNFQWLHVQVALLMDIREQLQQLNRQASCYRIPLALDAMYELGVEARRRKRAAAAKRKKAKAS